MTSIRALIVDDEPLARSKLRRLLESEPDIAVTGECGSAAEAIAVLDGGHVDLMFLDVQMPEGSGFDVVEAVGAERLPVLVFVTAHDQYALRAFDAQALDYLLKPFDRERFQRALGRARAQIRGRGHGAVDPRLLSLLEGLKPAPRYVDRLVIRSAGKVVFLGAAEVDWIESASNYVRLWSGGTSHLLRETMSALEARLDPRVFVRVHRTAIVNLERVKEMLPWFHGDYVVILRDGTRVTTSKGYRRRLREILGLSGDGDAEPR